MFVTLLLLMFVTAIPFSTAAPVLCRAAPARYPAGSPEPAAIQDFAGGSESLNVRASSSKLSGSATSRGSDLSASIVRRNCWR
jgi:hypothetical protein